MPLRNRFTRLREWIRRALREPTRELDRAQRLFAYAVSLVAFCARKLRRDRAGQIAAALTFRTLFSLLPTAALALVALQAFVGPTERNELKDTVLEWTLGPVTAAAPGNGSGAPGTGEPARDVEFDEARQALGERVETVIAELESIDFGSIGLVGLLLFVYAATGLLSTIERSFDTVYSSKRKRPWRRRLPIYYTVVTLGPILLSLGLWLRELFVGLLEAGGSWTGWLATILVVLSPLLTSWLVLMVLYLTMPTARVSLRAAAIGSLVAAVATGLTAEAFRFYVSRAALSTLYGALALLPLFLLWIYVVWLIVLFGLEVAFTLQVFPGERLRAAGAQRLDPGLIDWQWAVPIMAVVGNAFHRGALSKPDDLTEIAKLPFNAVQKLLTALTDADLLLPVERGREIAYSLARPADTIGIDEVVRAVRPDQLPGRQDEQGAAAWQVVEEMNRSALTAASAKTLADLIVEEDPA